MLVNLNKLIMKALTTPKVTIVVVFALIISLIVSGFLINTINSQNNLVRLRENHPFITLNNLTYPFNNQGIVTNSYDPSITIIIKQDEGSYIAKNFTDNNIIANSSDASLVIQKSIDTLSGKSGIISFDYGIYNLTSNIVIKNSLMLTSGSPAGYNINTAGNDGLVANAILAGKGLIVQGVNESALATGVTIKNIGLLPDEDQIALNLTLTGNTIIEGVSSYGGYIGLLCNFVLDSTFRDSSFNGALYGIKAVTFHNNLIERCIFDHNYIYASDICDSAQVTWISNLWQSNYGERAINFELSKNHKLINNYFEDNGYLNYDYRVISISGNSASIDIDNNYFAPSYYSNPKYIIYTIGVNTIIHGNTFDKLATGYQGQNGYDVYATHIDNINSSAYIYNNYFDAGQSKLFFDSQGKCSDNIIS
jgi:hypothetical protein